MMGKLNNKFAIIDTFKYLVWYTPYQKAYKWQVKHAELLFYDFKVKICYNMFDTSLGEYLYVFMKPQISFSNKAFALFRFLAFQHLVYCSDCLR